MLSMIEWHAKWCRIMDEYLGILTGAEIFKMMQDDFNHQGFDEEPPHKLPQEEQDALEVMNAMLLSRIVDH